MNCVPMYQHEMIEFIKNWNFRLKVCTVTSKNQLTIFCFCQGWFTPWNLVHPQLESLVFLEILKESFCFKLESRTLFREVKCPRFLQHFVPDCNEVGRMNVFSLIYSLFNVRPFETANSISEVP